MHSHEGSGSGVKHTAHGGVQAVCLGSVPGSCGFPPPRARRAPRHPSQASLQHDPNYLPLLKS